MQPIFSETVGGDDEAISRQGWSGSAPLPTWLQEHWGPISGTSYALSAASLPHYDGHVSLQRTPCPKPQRRRYQQAQGLSRFTTLKSKQPSCSRPAAKRSQHASDPPLPMSRQRCDKKDPASRPRPLHALVRANTIGHHRAQLQFLYWPVLPLSKATMLLCLLVFRLRQGKNGLRHHTCLWATMWNSALSQETNLTLLPSLSRQTYRGHTLKTRYSFAGA